MGETNYPVSEGEILHAECISQGRKGDGIFKVDGLVVIVPNTEMGQSYEIEITKVQAKVAFGKVYSG